MKKTIKLSAILLMALFVGGCGIYGNKQNNNPLGVNSDTNINNDVKTDVVSGENNLTSESMAEFRLNELLRDVPTLVVGTNNQITGRITVNPTEPAKINISEIKLDARTFVTDNEMRNKNIVELILKSNEPQNQFIIFKPTDISGVPNILVSGETFPVKITGDLTISGTTKPTIFDGTITWKDDGTLSGLAETDLVYANFGLTLPDFSFFSDVDEIAKLKITIKADLNK